MLKVSSSNFTFSISDINVSMKMDAFDICIKRIKLCVPRVLGLVVWDLGLTKIFIFDF